MKIAKVLKDTFFSGKSVMALAIATATLSIGAQADVVGASSDASYVVVDEAASGKAGIGIDSFSGGSVVDADHFALPAVKDTNDVYVFSGRELVDDYGAPGPGHPFAPDHSTLGVWAFKQVGNQDVWFGEWNQEAADPAPVGTTVANTHTVFYVGSNPTTSANRPTTDATYTVNTIRNYAGTLPTSTFNVTFSAATPQISSSIGDIKFSALNLNISGSDVTFNGAGVATVGADSGGNISGSFYGNQATAVAGIVTFGNRDKDAAFGGLKN